MASFTWTTSLAAWWKSRNVTGAIVPAPPSAWRPPSRLPTQIRNSPSDDHSGLQKRSIGSSVLLRKNKAAAHVNSATPNHLVQDLIQLGRSFWPTVRIARELATGSALEPALSG